MKSRIISLFLCTSLICYNVPAFANDSEFNASKAFENYASYDDSQVHYSWKHYYVVSKSNGDNSKALFSEDKQLTDFIYDSIDVNDCGIIVSQKKENAEYFGLIDDENYTELLPVKYKSIENYEVIGYIAENTDNSKEYYIVKMSGNEAPNNVSYEETDKLYILNSYDDLKNALKCETETTLTPIEGLDSCCIKSDGSVFYVNIVDKNGENLVDTQFRKVENKLGEYDTLKVYYPVGMQDLSAGLLSKDLKTIVPEGSYSSIDFVTQNNNIYAKAVSAADGSVDYYDLKRNKVDLSNAENNSYSKWAEESINKSIELNLIPQELQSNYTAKITRQEFCRLAMQTYIAKTGKSVDESAKSPFTDVDDIYITNAYNLKIVSGVGNNKFAPNNNITRQEAAVMLNNLADVIGIEKGNKKSDKFVDENYFADWAKDAIYTVCGIKSGDTYVMAGTGNNKFSPWMNYTREQAIATMYRLYNCEEINLFYDGQYLQPTNDVIAIYGDRLYYTVSKLSDNKKAITELVSIKKDGTERQVLTSAHSVNFEAIVDNYLYYVLFDEDANYNCYSMKLDGSEVKKISETQINRVSQRQKVHNDKYNFYTTTEFFNEKSDYLYITRSDLNGKNEKRLYSNPISGQIILYGDYIYFISSTELVVNDATQYTQDIMRIDFDGNAENITQNSSKSLDVSEIIKVDDDKIYFKRTTFLDAMPQNSDLIYSINIDGTDEKLIY